MRSHSETTSLPAVSGATATGEDPAAPSGWRLARDRSSFLQLLAGLVLIVLSIWVPALWGSAYWSYNFLIVNLFITVAVLQNMLLSDAGQVSFGQGAVFGLAAYTAGIVAGLWGYSYGVGFAAGVLAAAVLGLLFALPALRVQGYYLGFVTLSAAVIFPEFLVAFNDVTNGINGISRAVPELNTPLFAGLSGVALMVMGLAAAALIGHALFRQTALGRQMRVAAVSPEAAMSLGLSPGRLRFAAFTIAGLGTGLAGALYVPVLGFVSPYAFRVELSIFFFFSVIVGGSGRLLGPVVGTWILYLVPNALLVDLANYRLLGYGIVALAIMLAFPDGLVGSVENALRRYRLRTRVPDVTVSRIVAAPVERSPKAAASPSVAAVEARQAHKTYGELVALDRVDITVAPATIHGLVGPNGSGKTTLLNAISGFVRLDSGTLRIKGHDVTRAPAYRIARLGVGRTFQTPRVFEEMSIWDNLEIGLDFARGSGRAPVLRSFADLRAAWGEQRPDLLPHAQRRLLEVIRVVAMDVDLLLLDEPAAGLSPEERRDFTALLRFLRDEMGKTIVLVEHDLHLVWRVADRITVLDAGAVIAEGQPEAIVGNPRVRALFTGSRHA
jgi:branched-chain amino acid transport system permease protein